VRGHSALGRAQRACLPANAAAALRRGRTATPAVRTLPMMGMPLMGMPLWAKRRLLACAGGAPGGAVGVQRGRAGAGAGARGARQRAPAVPGVAGRVRVRRLCRRHAVADRARRRAAVLAAVGGQPGAWPRRGRAQAGAAPGPSAPATPCGTPSASRACAVHAGQPCPIAGRHRQHARRSATAGME